MQAETSKANALGTITLTFAASWTCPSLVFYSVFDNELAIMSAMHFLLSVNGEARTADSRLVQLVVMSTGHGTKREQLDI